MCVKSQLNSWKSTAKSAFIQSLLSVVFCIAYTYVVLLLTGGEEFVGKHPTYEILNGIRYDVVLVICGILASLIPIMLLRYSNVKFLFLYIPLSIIFYFVLMLLCVLFLIDDKFDLINYALSSVPIASFIGTVISIIINKYYGVEKGIE